MVELRDTRHSNNNLSLEEAGEILLEHFDKVKVGDSTNNNFYVPGSLSVPLSLSEGEEL